MAAGQPFFPKNNMAIMVGFSHRAKLSPCSFPTGCIRTGLPKLGEEERCAWPMRRPSRFLKWGRDSILAEREQTMNDDGPLSEKEKERAALSEQAAGIVRAASAERRALTADEDSQVLALMTRVRVLEEEIKHLKRHTGGRANP